MAMDIPGARAGRGSSSRRSRWAAPCCRGRREFDAAPIELREVDGRGERAERHPDRRRPGTLTWATMRACPGSHAGRAVARSTPCPRSTRSSPTSVAVRAAAPFSGRSGARSTGGPTCVARMPPGNGEHLKAARTGGTRSGARPDGGESWRPDAGASRSRDRADPDRMDQARLRSARRPRRGAARRAGSAGRTRPLRASNAPEACP